MRDTIPRTEVQRPLRKFSSEFSPAITQVRRLQEGDVLTHVDGQPVLGSLEWATRFVEQAGDEVSVRVQTERSSKPTANGQDPGYRIVQHMVQQGDSVDSIAEQYRTTTEQIRSDNRRVFPVGEPGFLRPGQTLTVRSRRKAGCSLRESRRGGENAQRRQILYEVLDGDSLESICTRFGADDAEVRRCNRSVFPVGETGTLVPGQTLTLFAKFDILEGGAPDSYTRGKKER